MTGGVRDHRTASRTTGCKSEPRSSRDQIEQNIRIAAAILEHTAHPMRPRRMHALVHRYHDEVARGGWSFFEFFTVAIRLDDHQRRGAAVALASLLAYADPTGEAAVRNVMRGAR